MASEDETLAIVTAMAVCCHENGLRTHLSFGRVIDELARRYGKVVLCAPVRNAPPDEQCDYQLQAANVHVISQPYYRSSVGALRHLAGITRAFLRACRLGHHIFVRGMVPYIGFLYVFAAIFGRKPCHWIVGNPITLLQTHKRAGALTDGLSLAYAWQDRFLTRIGRAMTGGAFLCNGQELAAIYRSRRTTTVVSSTITAEEFFPRVDTCLQERVRILFIGFVRPEKGLEYLVEAVGMLRTPRPWELVIVGPWDKFPAYRATLDGMIERGALGERVRWEGYASYGPTMWRYLRECDVFVLPTLSEGTPRVLVEARANSIPIVSTNVGGIPTSVTDGVDGLLVPPKDAAALAAAIDRVIADGSLRRSLIARGLLTAKSLTVDRFVDSCIAAMS